MDNKKRQKPSAQKAKTWQKEQLKFLRTCTQCKSTIEPDSAICGHCGVRLQTKCPYCGNPLPPAGAQICAHCGKPLKKA